ncbi:rod shape-determining protein MreC [Enterococcus sp. 8G7_MSG3316]|uniref:Cell shape-determining protein MreC n=1 Tax=Candidatus Enterococcus testudinis TaxID=1834191 RepID=A0A242AAC9_9ENTE|nr:rod shape-determining protein MreC [Enterococcus sp. 8G7_MSG3316]OTN77995.1 rod shape-determining protein MreC [Enterococcus sp. 8G7_MSG3316]
MKKFNPNKNIIITLIIVILVVTVLSVTIATRAVGNTTNVVQSTVNDTMAIVDKVITAPIRWIENGANSVKNLFVTYEENERLKEKLDSYDELAQSNDNYQREIDALKEELALNETLTNYDKISANVINRSPDTWQDMLVVDQGTKDGVEINMAVMSQKGLIGRVIEVNAASSKVELLTSENQNSNHFPVRISGEDGENFGILSSYDQKEKSLVITQLTGSSSLKEGDVVQTSGLGGNSPADLAIGTVVSTTKDEFGLDTKVYVKPYAQMYDIQTVTIIKRLAGDE